MATINSLKTKADLVANATAVGENTAGRVGGALQDAADLIARLMESTSDNKNADDVRDKSIKSLQDALGKVRKDLQDEGANRSSRDEALQGLITALQGQMDTLTGKNASKAIENFNEIIKFLGGVKDDNTLTALLDEINNRIEILESKGEPDEVFEVLLFEGFETVDNYSVSSVVDPVELFFDSSKQRFFPKKGGKFFENWLSRNRYLDPNTGAPYAKKIYINTVENIPYRWNGTRMKLLSAVGKDGRLLRFVHGTGDTSRALVANAMHIWGVVPELRLSLAENPEPEFVAEYCFQFTSPADRGTSLILPKGLKWGGQDDDDEDYKPQIRPGITYQAIISENVIIIMGAK